MLIHHQFNITIKVEFKEWLKSDVAQKIATLLIWRIIIWSIRSPPVQWMLGFPYILQKLFIYLLVVISQLKMKSSLSPCCLTGPLTGSLPLLYSSDVHINFDNTCISLLSQPHQWPIPFWHESCSYFVQYLITFLQSSSKFIFIYLFKISC